MLSRQQDADMTSQSAGEVGSCNSDLEYSQMLRNCRTAGFVGMKRDQHKKEVDTWERRRNTTRIFALAARAEGLLVQPGPLTAGTSAHGRQYDTAAAEGSLRKSGSQRCLSRN